MEQMVAHHTLGGCNLQPGDLLGTGTISCGVGKMNCRLPVVQFLEEAAVMMQHIVAKFVHKHDAKHRQKGCEMCTATC